MTKSALITAAASGIGAVVAQAARKAGYRVTISDRDEDKGRALAAAHDLAFIACDLADEAQIVSLIARTGPVDLLVNNGGVSGPTAPVSAVASEDWRTTLDINLTAPFIACREMVPLMIEAGGGVIINMSSAAGKTAYPNRAPYAASKWGVLGLTAALAHEVGVRNIRVNAILPAAVRGERIVAVVADYAAANQMSVEAAEAHYLQRQATRRFIEPEEIAATILFLASDAARSITGQFISVDGGYQ